MREDEVPVSSLRVSTIQLLSEKLNSKKVIPTPSGLPRDWRGLAELLGFDCDGISRLEALGDPTGEIFKKMVYSTRTTEAQAPLLGQALTLSDLKAYLGVMDRFDIVDDAQPFFESDLNFYWSKIQQRGPEVQVQPLDHQNDHQVLTYDDMLRKRDGLEFARYDAFILYADEDEEFANEVVNRMESNYKLKMCIKDRDLMPGGGLLEHEVMGKVIEERCNRLLVIFSPNFLASRANTFLVSYTQALSLELNQRKIIPCMYKKCELPLSVRYSYCLDYNRAGKLWNFWDRLGQSLTSVPQGSSWSSPNLLISGSPESHLFNGNRSLTSGSSPLPLDPPPYSEAPEKCNWDPQKEKRALDSSVRPGETMESNSSSSQLDPLVEPGSQVSPDPQSPLKSNFPLKVKEGKRSPKWLKKMVGPLRKSKSDKQKTKVPVSEVAE